MSRVLVLGAGGPAGANFCRCLDRAGHDVVAADTNRYRRAWLATESTAASADNTFALLPEQPEAGWTPSWIARMVGPCDLVYAQPDSLVYWLSFCREEFAELGLRTCLPDHSVIGIAQDKFMSGLTWQRAGLIDSWTVEIRTLAQLEIAEEKLGYPYWLRARQGAGARAATVVRSAAIARHWFAYWDHAHGLRDFVAQRYLPGRDYAFISLWREGVLVTSSARERLEYIYPQLSPSGITGTPSVARTVHSDAVNAMAVEAIRALDPAPHGFYCVDLREDALAIPRPTEINAGRTYTTVDFLAEAGLNLPDLYVCMALGKSLPTLPQYDAAPAGLYWIRHMDCPAKVLGEDDVA